MTEYVYIIQEREHLNAQKNIYKIGKTKRPPSERIKEYPKGSKPITFLLVNDCNECEKELKTEFIKKFIQRKDIGVEYFEGELDDIVDMFLQIAKTQYKDTILGKCVLLREENTGLLGYKIINVQWNEHTKNNIDAWKGNRIHDDDRVDEIYNAIKQGEYVPKNLHVAKSKDGTKYVCFDGNHRRHVFNRFLEEGTSHNVDIVIMDTNDDMAIHTCFKNLSKSLTIPEMLTGEIKKDIHEHIEKLFQKYKTLYKDFFKTSPMPHRPHINSSFFQEAVNRYCVKTNSSIEDIERLLIKKNNEYIEKSKDTNWRKQYKENVLEKCDKNKFYLFIDGTNFI